MIPHNVVSFTEAEAKVAYDVIMSGKVACGEKVKELEETWVKTVGTEAAACVSSGSTATRLALRALNIGAGDEVVVPGYCCGPAIINPILTVGASYILADVTDELVIDWQDVIAKITDKTKAIIIVHTFGVYAYMENLDIPVIEDIAHGIFQQAGDLAVTSFAPTKFIGALGGGMVSGKRELVECVKDWRAYEDKKISLRQNDVLNDVSAVVVLERLKIWKEIRLARLGASAYYDDLLCIKAGRWFYPYRYIIRVKNAREVSARMKAKGICAEQPIWDYRLTINWPKDLLNTDSAFETVLSLPFWPSISTKEQEHVIKVLRESVG